MTNTLLTRRAVHTEIDQIVKLSSNVQQSLSASGSLQEIGPLQHNKVTEAVENEECFILHGDKRGIIGCVFVSHMAGSLYPNTNFDVTAFAEPRMFMHGMMLSPDSQGRGFGLVFFREVMSLLCLRGRQGSVLLDCWAGAEKLRDFYLRTGCELVATVPENDYEVAVFVYRLGGLLEQSKR